MSKILSLISGCNGKPEAYQASRQVECSKCETAILKSLNCVRIPTRSGAFSSKKIFCLVCFEAILGQTKKDIVALEKIISHAN